MIDLLFVLSIFTGVGELVKEKRVPVIPAENWTNKELYQRDILNGISHEQRMKNVVNGKYKQAQTQTKKYPKPHKGTDGKILIENSLLFEEDKRKYGVVKAYEFAEQGKYNLTKEELEKEHKRIEEKYNKLFDLVARC